MSNVANVASPQILLAAAEPPEGFDYTGGPGVPGVGRHLLESRSTEAVGESAMAAAGLRGETPW